MGLSTVSVFSPLVGMTKKAYALVNTAGSSLVTSGSNITSSGPVNAIVFVFATPLSSVNYLVRVIFSEMLKEIYPPSFWVTAKTVNGFTLNAVDQSGTAIALTDLKMFALDVWE